ncbi:MAG: response regulator [Candidatus Thiodiazotropha sp.]
MLIVDDEPGIRNFLQRGLTKYFALVETADNVVTADELREHCHFDLIITDIELSGATGGVEWVKTLREQGGQTG